jgi:hypothetical protein
VYISRDLFFDETVFPFSELHSNAGARLRKEILLLPNHLLNPGDALPNADVTNDQSSSQNILQDYDKNSAQNDDHLMQNTCDGGVYLAPAPGVRFEADMAAAPTTSGGLPIPGGSANCTNYLPRTPRRTTGSAAPPTRFVVVASPPRGSATSPSSPPGG